MQKSIKINYLEHSTAKFYSIPAAATDRKQYVYQQLVIVNKKKFKGIIFGEISKSNYLVPIYKYCLFLAF